MNPNSLWLMEWHDRMVAKYGHPIGGIDWCLKLANFMGEAGNNNPSDAAIREAEKWERKNPERRRHAKA